MRKKFFQFIIAAILIAAICIPVVAAPKKAKPKVDKEAARRMSVPAGKPEIFELEPRGIQRGVALEIKLIGTNLVGLTEVKFSNTNFSGESCP